MRRGAHVHAHARGPALAIPTMAATVESTGKGPSLGARLRAGRDRRERQSDFVDSPAVTDSGTDKTPPVSACRPRQSTREIRCLTVAVVRVGPSPQQRPSSYRGRPV